MPRIVVVGSTNIDLTFLVPRLPRPSETLTGKELSTGFGGKGANQAVMAARLGAQVTMISTVGADAFGEQALANYRACGVDTTHVRAHPSLPTGTAAILVDEQARNCIVVVAGANSALSAQDILAAKEVIQSADVVLTQLETPIEAAMEAFRLARSSGVRTILNPAPVGGDDAIRELLALTDLLIPNEIEAGCLVSGGVGDSSLEAITATAQGLREGAQTVIVTLGERGAVVVGPEGSEHIPAIPVRAVDPTAAGDAFIGSFAVFLAQGTPLSRAVRKACTVAALTVTLPGAQSSFPPRKEIESFLAAHEPL